MRFQFIEKNRSSFPVKKMCHVLDVSSSGYYRWRVAPLSPRRIENENLKIGIKDLFARHNGMAGSPMITADLDMIMSSAMYAIILAAKSRISIASFA